jgi:hypothetical protein
MGYDLYWVDEPSEVLEAMAAAHESQRQEDYQRWSVAKQESHSYWREAIWSMGGLRNVLEFVDMLDDRPEPDSADWQEANGDDDKTEVLLGFGDDVITIPYHRLCSNDGWYITAPQANEAASRINALLNPGEGLSYLDQSMLEDKKRRMATAYIAGRGAESVSGAYKRLAEFVLFLQGAGEYGSGFRVY